MRGLTQRQLEMLGFLRQFIAEHKYPPTIREISAHFNIAVKAAHDHIHALVRKGVLRCDNNRSRAIEILEDEENHEKGIEVPLLGRVAAGQPLLAESNWEGTILVPRDLASPGDFFAVQVKGDSMIEAGIMDGDIALIRHQLTANNGDIVVAMIDEESFTLKKFYKEDYRVRLEPANKTYSVIWVREVTILGRLRGLIRQYG